MHFYFSTFAKSVQGVQLINPWIIIVIKSNKHAKRIRDYNTCEGWIKMISKLSRLVAKMRAACVPLATGFRERSSLALNDFQKRNKN